MIRPICRTTLFTLTLAAGSLWAKCQTCDCALLRAVLHQKEFRQEYGLDLFDGETILIVDSVGYFIGCQDSLGLHWPDVRIGPSTLSAKGGSKKQFWIHIHKVIRENRKLTRVYLWHKDLSNRYGYLRYKRGRMGYVLKGYQFGQF